MAQKLIENPAYNTGLTNVVALNVEGTNPTNHYFEINSTTTGDVMCNITFQHGAIGPNGVNGILNEDLMVILIDRLESFQRSKLKCRENENALSHLYEALFWMNQRQARQVKKTTN